jgi:PDZ domain-containing protein/C2 domain-containing protein
MRVYCFVLAILAAASGCAYQRYTTPLHQELNPKRSEKSDPAGLYTLRLIDAEVPRTKVSGLTWDDDGSGPDPFVRLYIDERLVWESEVKENQTHPQWNAVLPRNIAVGRNSDFRLELWDFDSAVSSDPIARIERRGLPETAMPNAQARLQLDAWTTLQIMVSAPRAHRGVGLSVEARPDALKVYALEPYSPAARAGIRPGDMIVGIGSERVSHMGPDDAVSELALAAERGHKLAVTDPSGKNEHEVTLDQGYTWLVL